MKKGPRLVLEHNIIFQIISDEHFWELVPEFEDMREDGEAAQPVAAKAATGCGGCKTLRKVLADFTSRFTLRIASLYEYNPDLLVNLRNYINQKLGYRPKEVLIYYKDLSGRPNQVRLK